MENTFILVCTANYGQTFQNKLSNFLTTLCNSILENQHHLIFHDKFTKDILWRDLNGKGLENSSNSTVPQETSNGFKNNRNSKLDIQNLIIKKIMSKYLILLWSLLAIILILIYQIWKVLTFLKEGLHIVINWGNSTNLRTKTCLFWVEAILLKMLLYNAINMVLEISHGHIEDFKWNIIWKMCPRTLN